jgi:hypothetical protein
MFAALLLSFGLPALIAHFGVATAATSLLTGTLGSTAATAVVGAGTKAVAGAAASRLNSLLHHIAQGGQVTDEHRQWLAQNQGVLYTPPKFDPAQQTAGPVSYNTLQG